MTSPVSYNKLNKTWHKHQCERIMRIIGLIEPISYNKINQNMAYKRLIRMMGLVEPHLIPE